MLRLLRCRFWKSALLARAARALALFQMRRRLDLDDVGAPIGELAHAGRAGAHAGQIEHGKAGKGLGRPGKRHFGRSGTQLKYGGRHSPICPALSIGGNSA